MFFSLVVKLGLEEGEVIPQLVVLRPVLLRLLKRTTSAHISPKSVRGERKEERRSNRDMDNMEMSCYPPESSDFQMIFKRQSGNPCHLLTVAMDLNSHSR